MTPSPTPDAITCPLCGELVKQVASATLSLALWQHCNWTCVRRNPLQTPAQMSIDANVAFVEVHEDGSGTLHLCDRKPEGSRGQSRLHFVTAPYEVTALNGLEVWGGDGQIMLGRREIAKRHGYTRISFIEPEAFKAAVAEYHRSRR